ncbi:hypothetical protein PJO47_29575, partial [Mycobacterium kansasii]
GIRGPLCDDMGEIHSFLFLFFWVWGFWFQEFFRIGKSRGEGPWIFSNKFVGFFSWMVRSNTPFKHR